ncbi:uncharacterized protein Dmoj_GI26543, isoform A [Drosophila mojavensis]|uniref:Uncharacterized protein, isoform A n=1 Tax=Drosophila mojavensis TaxID=7230 RepID=A0A0Q9XCW2_DROMO|nr:uncharacterized protein Dmoj_GI26543, isoform A [Drosophila mojavensis]
MSMNLFFNFKMRFGKRFSKNCLKRPLPVEWQEEEKTGQLSKKFKPNSWTECNQTSCSKDFSLEKKAQGVLTERSGGKRKNGIEGPWL